MQKYQKLFTNYYLSILNEGGNAFSDVERITKDDLVATVAVYTKMVLAPIGIKNPTILGSGGKKADSGDIDLGIDYDALVARYKTTDVGTIIAKLEKEVSGKVKDTKPGPGMAQVWTSYPQYTPDGKMNGKLVQIDLMVGKPDWIQDFYSSGYSMDAPVEDYLKSKYKGSYKNLLLSALMNIFSEVLDNGDIKKFTISGKGANQVIKTMRGANGTLKNPKTISSELVSENYKEFFQNFFQDETFDPKRIITMESWLDYLKNNKVTKKFYTAIVDKFREYLIQNKMPIPEEI